MKKSLLAALFSVFASSAVFGQYAPPIDTILTENFDGTFGADSISANYNTDSANVIRSWNDTSALASTGTMSFHTKLYSSDSIIFETDAFSTETFSNVRFSFDQICKIRYNQKGFIQMSRDNGSTWVTVNSGYKGISPQFNSTGWFNELSYPSNLISPYWDGATISNTSAGTTPTNSWWAHEIFDLSSYLGAYDSTAMDYGFANCKVRFVAMPKSGSNPAPTSLAGWFIDNIMVEVAPCELEPPALDWTNVSVYAKPDGARYMPSQDVRVKATDNLGVDSMRIFFQRYDYAGGTWSAWMDSLMTPTLGSTCPTSEVFTYQFKNINLYDTINWYVEVYDCACPNIVRDPDFGAASDYYSFYRDDAPPPICGTTTSNSFPYVIETYPYLQDFENPAYWVAGTGTGATGTSHRGSFPFNNPQSGINWKAVPNQTQTGYAWSIRKGATATAQTGPDVDASKGTTAGVYLYTEADQGSANDSTFLFTSCMDLTSLNCAIMKFKYHMFGNTMGRIRIDVDTGFNSSVWVRGIDQIVGEQQTSNTDAWKEYSVSLNDFVGKIVRVRFTAKRGTGLRSDAAIDDIEVYEPTPTDIALREVYNPENGYCSYSNNETIDLWVQSAGCMAASSIPVTWKREYTNLSGTTTTVTHTENITSKTLYTGDSVAFTFATGPDMSGYGTYKVWVYVGMSGDTINDNDTIGPIAVVHEQPYSNFPLVMNFDGPGTTPGNNTPVNPGTHPYTSWTELPAANSGSFAFMVGTGFTPTISTGPIRDFSEKGNYLVTEGNYGSAPKSAAFVSPCIDLSGMTSPVLQYRLHMFGADVGAVVVQWIKSGENTWSNTTPPKTTKLSDEKTPWEFMEVDLSAEAGNIVKLRFIVQKTGGGIAADVAIDEIAIFDKPAKDVGIDYVKNPTQQVNLTGAAAGLLAKFEVRNHGSATQSNIPIKYTVTPTCGSNAGVSTTYNFTYTSSISPGDVKTVTDNTNTVNWPTGTFVVEAWTELTGDNNAWNDSTYHVSSGWPETPIDTGFIADFENCNEGSEHGFWFAGDLEQFGVSSLSALGNNNGIGSNPNKNIIGNTTENFYFPRFVGFDTIAGAELRLTHDIDLGVGDQAYIQNLSGGSWSTIGYWDPQNIVSTNWYNTGSTTSGGSWQGNIGSTVSIWPLSSWNFSSAPLILRGRLESVSGNKDGWNIDKVEIYIPPQNSAAIRRVETVEYIPVPDQNNHLRVIIQNTGAKVLDSCLVEFSTDGGTTWSTPEKVVFNPPMYPGKSSWYEFTNEWISPASGVYNVCARTSRPDNKPDNLASDDEKCESIVIPDKIIMSQDSAYCNDFDDPNKTPWLTFNTFDKGGLNSWEMGTPNNAPIISANSGSTAWMTNLDGNYKSRDSSSLYSPVFVLDSGQVYGIDFMHAFSTEQYHDGGNVDITFDGGLSWHTIGTNLYGATWYNTNFVTSLDIYKPGWTGLSNGWENASICMAVDTARNAILRFRFASDHTVQAAGWAIDDFCFFETDAACNTYTVGQEEIDLNIGVGNLYPNPSTGATRLPVAFQQSGELVISVRNTQGQLIYERTEYGQEGINVFEFDASGWAAGMYLVEARTVQGVHTQRLIVE